MDEEREGADGDNATKTRRHTPHLTTAHRTYDNDGNMLTSNQNTPEQCVPHPAPDIYDGKPKQPIYDHTNVLAEALGQ